MPAPSARPIRLRQYSDDFVLGPREGVQCRQREFGRAGKRDTQRVQSARAGAGIAVLRPCTARSLRSFSSFLRMRSRFRSDR